MSVWHFEKNLVPSFSVEMCNSDFCFQSPKSKWAHCRAIWW